MTSRLFLLVVMFFSVSAANLAQGEDGENNLCDQFPTITYDSEHAGTITNETSATGFCFEAEAGDQLSVAMERTSGDLDPLLILLNAETNETLASNDDRAQGERDARVTYTTFVAGTYAIIATRYQAEAGSTTGEFRLTLTRGIDDDARAAATGDGTCEANNFTVVNEGEAVTGRVDDGTPAVTFCFYAEAGETVNFQTSVTEGDLRPVQVLLDPFSGQTLATSVADEDGQGTVLQHTAEQTGALLIGVARFDGDTGTTSGAFALRLTREGAADEDANGANAPSAELCADAETITYGETLMGTIDDANTDQGYCFVGQAGANVSITMSGAANGLDTFLALLDAETGDTVDVNDDSNGTDSALNVTLPADGDYLIVATRYQGAQGTTSGAFELSLNRQGGPPEAADSRPGQAEASDPCERGGLFPFLMGTQTEGEITDATTSMGWCVRLEPGVSHRISATRTSGDLDTVLAVVDPETNDIVASNDDAQRGSRDSALSFTPEGDNDAFLVVVTRYSGEQAPSDTTGEFSLRVMPE